MKLLCFIALALLLILPESHAGWTPTGNAVGNMQRINSSPEMKRCLDQASRIAGRNIEVFSAFRSQGYQNNLRKKRGCLKRSCSGTASRSQHTYGIAADVKASGISGSAWSNILKKARANCLGNRRGGVAKYCGNEGHIDLGSLREWNACGG